MSETINPAALPIMFIADGKNVQISLNGVFDASDFLLKPASLNDAHWWMRDVPYIQVTDGITEEIEPDTGRMIRKTDLQTGKFYVVRDVFLDRFSSWYELQRIGRNWKSRGTVVTAKQVKQWIQNALLPFKINAREILDIYQQLDIKCSSPETQVEPLAIVTSEDLNTKEYKRPPAIVDGFLYAGLVIFAAPAKTGKSFLALDLACSVAEGKPFWNFSTAKGDVLYLDLEGTEWRTQKRLPAIGRKKAPAGLSHAYRAANVDTGLIQQLESWINSVENPKLIILDTLQHCKGRVARGEDAYAADTRFMKPLHDLAISKSLAIVAVTHTRKSNGFVLDDPFDSVLGSVAQYGNSDAGWLISGKRDEDVKTFSAVGRDFEPVSFEIQRGKDGRWIFNGTTEEQQEVFHRNKYQQDKAVAVIRQQLTGSGGAWRVTAQEFLEIAAKETGEYLEVDATRMGRRIRELAPDLLKYDDILVRWPNKNGGVNGRKITFEQRGYNGN
jgi:RecA-family ATPase